MTESRIVQILEQEMLQGWKAEKIIVAAAETKAVKASAGKVARIRVITAVITVTPKDGATAAWGALTNAAELDLGGTPMQFNTSINLEFSAAGEAYILYK